MEFNKGKGREKHLRYKVILLIISIFLSAFLINLTLLYSAGIAGNPNGAYYSEENTNLYWFLIISDTHIGKPFTNADKDLKTTVEDVYKIINPKFIINTGDLTDQLVGKPTFDQKIKQWDEYYKILNDAGMTAILNNVPKFTDAPGNHDQYYETSALTNYKLFSVQGRAKNDTQRSWVYNESFGKYHFITIATPHPLMTDPIVDGIDNDCPGHLSIDVELDFIQTTLGNEEEEGEDEYNSNLTFLFGHHTLQGWGSIITGRETFIDLACNHKISMYAYGHTHRGEYFREPYFESCQNSEDKFLALNVPSLATDNEYTIVAVDNDGVSTTFVKLDEWPIVLITAPLDKNLGGTNPYTYKVPSRTGNPIRALVFSEKEVNTVQYRVDGGQWQQMLQIRNIGGSKSYLWGVSDWDTSALDLGEHTLEVRACIKGWIRGCSKEGSHIVSFEIEQIGGLYVGTQGGPSGRGAVFQYSKDGSWSSISEGTDIGQAVMDIVFYQDALYVGTQTESGYGGGSGNGQIWRYNGDNSWTKVGEMDNSAMVLLNYNNELYVATNAAKLYRYTGTPGNWTLVGDDSSAGTGFRSGIVSNISGASEIYLGDLNTDRFSRYNSTDGLVFLEDHGGSCIWDFEEYNGGLYAGAWYGPIYKTTNGRNWNSILSTGYEHNWSLATFQDLLYIGSGNGDYPTGYARLWTWNSIALIKIWEWSVNNYAEGITSLATDGDLLYIGTGIPDGYFTGDGVAEVWTYDGSNFTRISNIDQFGGGVQSMLLIDQ
ncbi:MAG: metallophosphoesterase [Candidatus Helarchaeota archaeon]|nr:metallophosphoesterase [Candidatus Helarchaeota archaeon]